MICSPLARITLLIDASQPVRTQCLVKSCRICGWHQLLDFSPDYTGALPTESVAQYKAFGDWVAGCYGSANAAATNWSQPLQLSAGQSVTVAVSPKEGSSGGAEISRVVLQEDQAKGQRIRRFKVEYQSDAAGSAQQFEPLLEALSLGHKRVIALNATTVTAIRLTVLEAVGAATIRFVGAQGARACVVPPAPPAPPCQLTSDYAYTGNAIGKALAGKSVAECCTLCRAKSSCVAFVRLESGLCTLYRSLGGGGVLSGAVSGSPTHDVVLEE